MHINSHLVSILFGVMIVCAGCSKSNDFQACGSTAVISFADNVCLSVEHDQLSDLHRDLIEEKATSGLKSIKSLMPVNDLKIRIVNDPFLVIPEIGMGGYNPDPNEVILSIKADFPELDNTLELHFIAQLAHEIHHAKRRRSVGYGNTLIQAVVSEGLADHFSIEVSGISPPPWSVALSGDVLQNWIDEASNSWNQPYNHSDWFVGTNPDIPRWTGYSIGFELVRNYLSENPDRMPSNLHNEPASSFRP